MTSKDAKKRLLARRTELLGDLTDKEHQSQTNTIDDEEDKSFERLEDEVLSALSHSDRMEITRIEAALARIAEGSYGRCAECDEPIAPARLEAMPDAVLCLDCASA